MKLQRTMGTKFALEIHKLVKPQQNPLSSKFKSPSPAIKYLLIALIIMTIIILPYDTPIQPRLFVNCGEALNSSQRESRDAEGGVASDNINQCNYYATIPRWSPICGKRQLVVADSGPQARPAHVASFLSIPYAAPPIGVLRFMPPGAPVQSSSAPFWTKSRAYELMPGGKISQLHEHIRPGPYCVHLSNWLPDNSQFHQHDNNASSTTKTGSPVRFESEDCLHVSLFVPVNELHGQAEHNRKPISGHRNTATTRLNVNSNHVNTNQINFNDDGNHLSPSQHQQQLRQELNSSIEEPNTLSGGDQQYRALEAVPQIWPILQAAKTISRNSNNLKQANNLQQKLPVVVLFSSLSQMSLNKDGSKQKDDQRPEDHDPHSKLELELATLAHKLNSIVIHFNYRIGLLGFLPFSDNQNQEQNSNAFNSVNNNHINQQHQQQTGSTRVNHAIWDQLGVLHWLKRNVASFGGNGNNLTLVALDNQASLCIQLLTMSPLSKGLFKRAILVHETKSRSKSHLKIDSEQMMNNNHEQNVLQLDQLLRQIITSNWGSISSSNSSTVNGSGGARTIGDNSNIDLRRRLAATLTQANQVLETSGIGNEPLVASSADMPQMSNGGSNNFIFDVLQGANLSRLARLSAQFKQLASEKLVAFSEQPTLDDPLLFPAELLTQLLAANRILPSKPKKGLLLKAGAELNYCLYLKSLLTSSLSDRHDSSSDFLGLLGGHFPWTSADKNNNSHSKSGTAFATNKLHLPPILTKNRLEQESHPSTSAFIASPNQTRYPIIANDSNLSKSQISIAFNNLLNLNLLNAVLSGDWSLAPRISAIQEDVATGGSSVPNSFAMQFNDEGDDDDNDNENLHYDTSRHNVHSSTSVSASSRLMSFKVKRNARQQANTAKASQSYQLDQFFESMGQIQIIFGLISIGTEGDKKENHEETESSYELQDQVSTGFHGLKNIAKFLSRLAYRSDQAISPSVASWLKWLELHWIVSSIKQSNKDGRERGQQSDFSSNHCDLSVINQTVVDKLSHQSSYAFKLQLNNRSRFNWLHDVIVLSSANLRTINKQQSTNLGQNLANFIFTGNPNPINYEAEMFDKQIDNVNHDFQQQSVQAVDFWPVYTPLDRSWRSFINSQPIDYVYHHPEASSTDFIKHQGMSSIINLNLLPYLDELQSVSDHLNGSTLPDEMFATFKGPIDEVAQCLMDTDAILQRSELIDKVNIETANRESNKSILLSHVRLGCLRNNINYWRDLLRKIAASDLNIITNLQSTLIKRLQTQSAKHHPNSITSRNLVHDELEFMNNQQRQLSDESESSIFQSAGRQQAPLNDTSHKTPTSRSLSPSYKDALGSALGIVIGSGLLILLLNLTVVFIIALRARVSAARENNVDIQSTNVVGVAESAMNQSRFDGHTGAGYGCDFNEQYIINPIQLEPIIKKPSLKRNNQFQNICTDDSPNQGHTMRKQLKFKLNEDGFDDEANHGMEEQEDIEDIIHKTPINYAFESDTNRHRGDYSMPIKSTNPIPADNKDFTSAHCSSSGEHSADLHQEKRDFDNNASSVMVNHQHQGPLDQWSQTMCSELTSNQEYSHLNTMLYQQHKQKGHQHHHHRRCPMSINYSISNPNKVNEPHHGISANSSATISVTPPNNSLAIDQSIYNNRHDNYNNELSIICSPLSLVSASQAQTSIEYGYMSPLDSNLSNNSPLNYELHEFRGDIQN